MCIVRNKVLILIVLCCSNVNIFASNIDSAFVKHEHNINQYAKKISAVRFNEQLADTLSKQLLAYFLDILKKENSLNYPFDSLQGIGKVENKSKKLRIFTWNIVRNNGTYTYYGLLQHYNKEKKQIDIFVLNDISDKTQNPENKAFTNKEWYGALYYELVENKMPDKNILYTLIGWDGNDLNTSKKIIESLYFTQSGKPKFGKSVFKINKKKQKRLIFEYSRMANMMVGYKPKMKMIVYDHLSPSESKYEGNPAFYGPDYSFDGLRFKNGMWEHFSEVPYQKKPKKIR